MLQILKHLKTFFFVLPLAILIVPIAIITITLHLLGKFITVILTYPFRRLLALLMPKYYELMGTKPALDEIMKMIGDNDDESETLTRLNAEDIDNLKEILKEENDRVRLLSESDKKQSESKD